MGNVKGNRTLTGTHMKLYYNGLRVADVNKVSIKITPQREDVQIGLDIDSKLTGLKGEGTITVVRTYTVFKEVLKEVLAGRDPRGSAITELADPDAIGGQIERYQINNIAFNEFPINYETGTVIKDEFPFGFTPTDMILLETIDN